jgi:hypothetical protein
MLEGIARKTVHGRDACSISFADPSSNAAHDPLNYGFSDEVNNLFHRPFG